MSKNFCCVTWRALSKELAAIKHKEIEQFVDKGMPASLFAPTIDVLETMGTVCPSCGTRLIGAPSAQVPALNGVDSVVPIKPVSRKCPACNGNGTMDGKPMTSEDDVKCIICHGSGKIDNKTIVERKVDPNILEALEAKRESIIKDQVGKKIDTSFRETE